MVVWKGDKKEGIGEKANTLNTVKELNVPNFYVITSEELKSLFNGKETSEDILNTSVDEKTAQKIKDAYNDVGVSSEVRTASGRAKNLVGGQRNNELVSVRISSKKTEKYKYKLNIGASKIIRAVKEVTASYVEKENSYPSIIVQKMIEPDYSGSINTNLEEDKSIVEVVEGLGTSLEEGLTKPHTYITSQNQIEALEVNEEQLKISRNPINGRNERETTHTEDKPIETEKIVKIIRKLKRKNLNASFVYKRGSFHIVDARKYNDYQQTSFAYSGNGILVTGNSVKGVVGRSVRYSEKTLPPNEYEKALITKKGGYTSRDSYKARNTENKDMVVQISREPKQGEYIEIKPGQDLEESSEENKQKKRSSREKPENPFKKDESPGTRENRIQTTATKILEIDPVRGEGLFIDRSGAQGYEITDRTTNAEKIPLENHLTTYSDIFAFDKDRCVLDARNLKEKGLKQAINYLKAQTKILMVNNNCDIDLLEQAVKNKYDIVATQKNTEQFQEKMKVAEHRFMLNKIRKNK